MESVQAAASGVGNRWIRRWWLPLLPALLVAAILLPRQISGNRFRRQIVETLSQSLNRPVRLDSVTLRLLPAPAFVLDNFEVAEVPDFGAEPVLRAASVTATLRASSLWHRRLEISSISLEAPSLNLVRNQAGRWNFDDTLLTAARIPDRPAGGRAPAMAAGRPDFPYIEATNARINFKSGAEKLPFSFEEADLALWLDTPQQWRLRFKAQPVRTDLTSSDAGLVRVEGSFHRAASIDETPIHLDARWDHAQLGELTRLVTGQDAGWRGGLEVRLQATGMAGAPQLASRIRITDVRRAEFVPPRRLDLESTCKAQLVRASRLLDAMDCLTPLGSGDLHLTGTVAEPGTALGEAQAGTSLRLILNKVPAAMLLETLRHLRQGVPEDWKVEGSTSGQFAFQRSAGSRWTGSGEAAIESLSIDPEGEGAPLVLSPVRLRTVEAGASALPGLRHTRTRPGYTQPPRPPADSAAGPELQMAPALIAGTSGATVSATLRPEGFQIHISGGMPMARLLQLQAPIRLPSAWLGALEPAGTADLDLTAQGPWAPHPDEIALLVSSRNGPVPPAPPRLRGTIHLRNAVLGGRLLPGAVALGSARITLGQREGDLEMVRWDGLTATYAGVPFDGSFWFPAACPSASGCVRHFDLRTGSVSGTRLAALITGAPAGAQNGTWMESWLRRLRSSAAPWPAMEGNLSIGTFVLGDPASAVGDLHGLQANLKIEGPKVTVTSLRGQAFEGAFQASGSIDLATDLAGQFTGTRRAYALHARLTHASAEAIRTWMSQAGVPDSKPDAIPAANPAAGSDARQDASPDAKPDRAAAVQANTPSESFPLSSRERPGTGNSPPKMTGTVDAEFSLTSTGASFEAVRRAAQGTFSFDWRRGGLGLLPDKTAEERQPVLRNPLSEFDRWTAQGSVAGGKLNLLQSRVQGRSGSLSGYRQRPLPVTGTIGLDGQIDLRAGEPPTHLLGTLLRPFAEEHSAAAKTAAVP